MVDPTAPGFWPKLFDLLLLATWQTLFVVIGTMIFTGIFGLILGIVLVATERGGVLEAPFGSRALGKFINWFLAVSINIGRSIPFIILMVALIPFTRFLLGSAFEVHSAIVPLTIAAVPFFARIVEISLKEVPPGLIEAGESLGATRWQLIWNIILPEAVPGLLRGYTTTAVSVIGYSAIVGVIGAGGLGDVALRYGHQRYSVIHIIGTVVILVAIVQLFQAVGGWLAHKADHR